MGSVWSCGDIYFEICNRISCCVFSGTWPWVASLVELQYLQQYYQKPIRRCCPPQTDRQRVKPVGRTAFVFCFVFFSIWWVSVPVRTSFVHFGDISYNVGEWYPSTLCTAVVRSFAWRNTCAPLLSTGHSHECWVGMDANLCTNQHTTHPPSLDKEIKRSACLPWLIERYSSSIFWSSVCMAASGPGCSSSSGQITWKQWSIGGKKAGCVCFITWLHGWVWWSVCLS